jgi:hypothetical protein
LPAWVRLLANGGREDVTGLWNGVERPMGKAVEVEVAAASGPTGENVGSQGKVEEHPVLEDRPLFESTEAQPSPTATRRPFGLEDMTSSQLAALIADPNRDERLALEAADVIAARGAWPELNDVVAVLCGSDEPDDQLLGLDLVCRYQGLEPTFRQAAITFVRDLARRAGPKVAAVASDTYAEMTSSWSTGS